MWREVWRLGITLWEPASSFPKLSPNNWRDCLQSGGEVQNRLTSKMRRIVWRSLLYPIEDAHRKQQQLPQWLLNNSASTARCFFLLRFESDLTDLSGSFKLKTSNLWDAFWCSATYRYCTNIWCAFWCSATYRYCSNFRNHFWCSATYRYSTAPTHQPLVCFLRFCCLNDFQQNFQTFLRWKVLRTIFSRLIIFFSFFISSTVSFGFDQPLVCFLVHSGILYDYLYF